jgi:hypothetical protein
MTMSRSSVVSWAVLSVACSASGEDRIQVVLPDAVVEAGVDAGDETDASIEIDASEAGLSCAEKAKLVYVLSDDGVIYAFLPTTLEFTKIGLLSCPSAPTAMPYSMAVDRSATAWVSYDDGNLYRVSTEDAACEGTGFTPNQHGFMRFGMAFVSDTPGSDAETLFAAPYEGNGLGRVDLETFQLDYVGPYDALFEKAELSGNAEGRLFGYFDGEPVVLAEIDKTNAHVVSQKPLPEVVIGHAWAFAFWGGDFYLFSAPGVTSRVDRYRPSDGSVVTVKTGVGFSVVGAGVSTCAPLAIPR